MEQMEEMHSQSWFSHASSEELDIIDSPDSSFMVLFAHETFV